MILPDSGILDGRVKGGKISNEDIKVLGDLKGFH